MQKVTGILFLIIFLYGCSVSRKNNVINIENTAAGTISEKSVAERNLTNNNFYIKKAEITFNNEGETVHLLATLKYHKEGRYLISIRTRSGVEVVRIMLANDTIMVNDRVNKKLYCGSIIYLESKYGISFRNLPVILGDYVYDSDILGKKIDCKSGKAEYYKSEGKNRIDYILNCRERKIEIAKFNSETGEGNIEVKLGNFARSGSYIYPVTSQVTDNKSKSEIRIDIYKIEFDTDENLKFIPGANYEKIVLK